MLIERAIGFVVYSSFCSNSTKKLMKLNVDLNEIIVCWLLLGSFFTVLLTNDI